MSVNTICECLYMVIINVHDRNPYLIDICPINVTFTANIS